MRPAFSRRPDLQAGEQALSVIVCANIVSDSASGLFFHVTEW
jgi:hypothetical protein